MTSLHMVIKAIEKYICSVALNCADGNLTKAAEALGVSRNTFSAKVKSHRIDPSRYVKVKKPPVVAHRKNPSMISSLKDTMVLEALRDNNWCRKEAARALSISPRTVGLVVKYLRDRGENIPDSPYTKKKKCEIRFDI